MISTVAKRFELVSSFLAQAPMSFSFSFHKKHSK